MGFIAGQYTATLGGSALGQIQEGIELRWQSFKSTIVGDNFAEARQDAVYRGVNLDALYTLMEYNAAAALSAFWPWDATFLDMGTVGVLESSLDKQLILTAVAGTPAAATPATITLPNCILADAPTGFTLEPALRVIAIQQHVYPNASGVFGTTT